MSTPAAGDVATGTVATGASATSSAACSGRGVVSTGTGTGSSRPPAPTTPISTNWRAVKRAMAPAGA